MSRKSLYGVIKGGNLDQSRFLVMKPKRARKVKAPIPTEHEEQVEFFARVFAFKATRDLPIFAIPNGGHRHKAVAAKLKAEGVRSGVPDIFVGVPRPGQDTLRGKGAHGLFIEMKRKGKYPTETQINWSLALGQQGYASCLCYTAEEAWQTLCSYLGIPTTTTEARTNG